VQQADATRCGGITAFLQVDALCQAYNIPLSGHTTPSLHTHVACATVQFKNLEDFHDHVRIEQMLFDGVPTFGERRAAARSVAPGQWAGTQMRGGGAIRCLISMERHVYH
jgi:L-alanine-DL-glutamate epimerase-like enolase superfamily enzyme